MNFVYIVKSSTTSDAEGMELDPIRFVTLDRQQALDYVDLDESGEFLWVDGYELDGTTVMNVA